LWRPGNPSVYCRVLPRRILILVLLSALLAALAARAEVTPAYPTAVLHPGGETVDVDLLPFFREPAARGSVVRVNVRIGTVTKPVYLGLNDQTQPITVANFVKYVTEGKYAGSFFHRLAKNFVLQGGGFRWNDAGQLDYVTTNAAIQNEPGLTNVRGTIAMAKLGGDPNSATSQWFVNLADNSVNLDGQNGGFTVFGSVLRDGMTVIDQVAALTAYDASSVHPAFDTLPLSSNSLQRVYTVETTATVVPPLAPGVTVTNPQIVSGTLTGTTLHLTSGARGTTAVKISAVDIDGTAQQATITVVVPHSDGWHFVEAADRQSGAFSYDAQGYGLYTLFGEYVVSKWVDAVDLSQDSTAHSFTITNSSGATLSGLTVRRLGLNSNDFSVVGGLALPDLAPGNSTTIQVIFHPTDVGARVGRLRIGSDPTGNYFELMLEGEGKAVYPVASTPPPQNLIVDGTGLAQVPDWTGTVTATDELGPVTITQSPAPGSQRAAGNYALAFTATNVAGRTTTVQSLLSIRSTRLGVGGTRPTAAYTGAGVPAGGGAPLAAGSTLTVFGTPAISDDRHLAAKVTIASGAARLAGIYFEDGTGASRVVARQGGASGVGTYAFKSFRDPLLSPAGRIAFWANLTGAPLASDEGVWTDAFGSLEPALKEGAPIPGLGALKLLSVTSMELRDDGLIALVKLVPVPKLVVANVNDTALVRITSRTTGNLLARTYQAHDGSYVQQISAFQPSAKSQGQGRWVGKDNILAKFTLVDKRIVLAQIDAAGVATTLLQTGAPGAKFSQRVTTLGLPAIGGSGVAVLTTKALVTGTTTATNDSTLLFAPTGAAFAEAVTENAAADVTGTSNAAGTSKFATFTDPAMNDQGALLFSATLRGGVAAGSNLGGLWQTDGINAPEPVARLGARATDADGNELPNTTWSSFVSFALPDGANAGPIFRATLAGTGATTATNAGLWAVDSTGLVRLLLRTGQTVTLPTGDKKISAFTVLNALPGSFGARRSYNANGSLAVQVTFIGGAQAILRLDIP
jgi:cyclophilin family peptidyl-prolyl cis-trans isomerase